MSFIGQDRSRSASSRRLARRVLGLIDERPVLVVFIVALAVRVFVAVFISPYFSGSLVLDDGTYHFMTTDMASGAADEWDPFTRGLYWRTATLLVPVTALYAMLGTDLIVAQLFVAVLGAAAAAVFTRLALEVMPSRFAVLAGSLLALMPSQVLWSSLFMKDAAVWLVLIGIALAVAIAGRSTGLALARAMGAVALLLFLLGFLREHTTVVAAWAVMGAVLFGHREGFTERMAAALGVGVLIPWLFVGLGPAGLTFAMNAGSLEERRLNNAIGARTAIVDLPEGETDNGETDNGETDNGETDNGETDNGETNGETDNGETDNGETDNGETDNGSDSEERDRPTTAPGSSVGEWENENGGVAAPTDGGLGNPNLRHLPRGLAAMTLEPTPLPFSGSLSLRLARLESLIWYPLLVGALVALPAVIPRRRVLAFPLICGAGILLMYALAEGNVGTAHRHRGEIVWVVGLLAVLGVQRIRQRRAAARLSGALGKDASYPHGSESVESIRLDS